MPAPREQSEQSERRETDSSGSRGINEGRMAAREVDLYLEDSTNLPVTGGIVKRTAQEILGRVVEARQG